MEWLSKNKNILFYGLVIKRLTMFDGSRIFFTWVAWVIFKALLYLIRLLNNILLS